MINQKVVNYLDITLNLLTEKYYPYRKTGNAPCKLTQDRITPRPSLSSYGKQSAKEFPTSPIAKKNLIKQPLYIMMPSSPGNFLNSTPITSSPIHILWFNPPSSKTVKTNVGQRFLKLIDKHFSSKNPLHKIFNWASVKVSYSCMPNIK